MEQEEKAWGAGSRAKGPQIRQSNQNLSLGKKSSQALESQSRPRVIGPGPGAGLYWDHPEPQNSPRSALQRLLRAAACTVVGTKLSFYGQRTNCVGGRTRIQQT